MEWGICHIELSPIGHLQLGSHTHDINLVLMLQDACFIYHKCYSHEWTIGHEKKRVITLSLVI